MKVKRPPRIFISYREGSTGVFASLLWQILAEHFGKDNLFLYTSHIPSDRHFARTIENQINSSDIFLAVIGKDWLPTIQENLASEEVDYVRWEIAAALCRDPDLVVIPVLVEGAQVPLRRDLPKDLERLSELDFSELSPTWLEASSRQLILEIETAFEESNKKKPEVSSAAVESKTPAPIPDTPQAGVRNSRLGFYGGSAAALISGTTVGIYYTYVTNNREWWRPIYVAFFAFVIGVIMSGSIGYGIGRLSEWGNDSRYSKLMGSAIGGIAGGVLAAIWSTIAFAVAGGDAVVETGPVAGAVVVSNLVVACGMLLPEWRAGGETALYAGIVLAVSSGVTLIVAVLILKQNQEFVDAVLKGTTIPGMLIAGSVAGFLSGIQIGITLFFCARKPHALSSLS
jgi:TIR domain-containing protein